MRWYWIVLITIVAVHAVNVVIIMICENWSKRSTDNILPYLCLTAYVPLIVLYYPIGSILHYKQYRGYYEKHCITLIQYLFGKRVQDE